MSELVLIRGLPGSGKSTLARRMVGYEHHEADDYFLRDGSYRFDPQQLHFAHAQCLERACDSMRRGADCVVANTFTRRWEMRPYIDAAERMGVKVRILVADGNWPNEHGVSEDVISSMRARWEDVA